MNDDLRPKRPAKTFARKADTKAAPSSNPTSSKPTSTVDALHPLHPRKLLAAPKKIHWWLKSLSKKQLIALAIVAVLLLIGAIVALKTILQGDPVTEPQITIHEPDAPPPTTVPSRMTGVQITPELNNLPSTGVMIENSPDARPQAGLSQADMVFEAIAEGGITRFLALYQESQPDYIGPVRSVRPYYLDFLMPFDAAIAHAGGSAEALEQIRKDNIKDIDHGANGSTFDRVSSRYAPHNLYTSRAKLLEAQNRRGYGTSTYTGLARKETQTPAATPTSTVIDLTISSALYNPHYQYDAENNDYKRSLGGKPHVDEKSGKQIAPKVVIALVMTHSYDGIYSVYGVNGSGTAYVFQDGLIYKGTWEKKNRTSQFELKNPDGSVLALTPGQTWVTLVTGLDKVKSSL